MKDRSPSEWSNTAAIVLLILIPVAFNAIMLLPELRLSIPTQNDDAMHYMFVQRASAALAVGRNPFDFWVPDLGFGFPQFLYYQHIPHLAVVLLHRVLFKQVDLLTLFNLIRYLLLVCFPLTVYWSMRTMEFSAVGAATAAAFASLVSGVSAKEGFEYESYIWSGYGMYTQLWAMHLVFIWLACMHRVLSRGIGYLSAVLVSSLLVLSHAFYAYIAALTTLPLLVVSLSPWFRRDTPSPASPISASKADDHAAKLWRCAIRLGIVATLATITTAYFWLPFFLQRAYFNLTPYSAGPTIVRQVRTAFTFRWNLLDGGRLPTMTAMVVLGAVVACLGDVTGAMLALLTFIIWFLLYFIPQVWPGLLALLPLHEALPFRRFIGGVDLGAILLVGVGGEWLWRRFAALPTPWHAAVPGLLVLILMVPPLYERGQHYGLNTRAMVKSATTMGATSDLGQVITTLKTLPDARVFLPLIGPGMALTFDDIPTTYAGQMLSLNSLLPFDRMTPTFCDIFNVRYIVLPRHGPAPKFLTPILKTRRFSLYGAGVSSYAQFAKVRWGQIDGRGVLGAQRALLGNNLEWLHGSDPAAGTFIRWDYPPNGNSRVEDAAGAGDPASGTITSQKYSADAVDLSVDCREDATLVIKVTYHPNWRVTIDGRPETIFMVSPSYIGMAVPAGHHEIHAEYQSSGLKKLLLLLSAIAIVLATVYRERFATLERAAVRVVRRQS